MSKILTNQPIIFTDLDGSLLDHQSYCFDAVKPLLETLETIGIPVIPITSKTFAEVKSLRIELNNRHPFIVENGAAIAIPKNYFSFKPKDCIDKDDFWVISNSQPRDYWNNLLRQYAQDFESEYETFSSIVTLRGLEGIQAITGLGYDKAELSNQRDYSEPVKWLGSEERKQEFIGILSKAGATLLQGGRFLALGGSVDKGSALLKLTQLYQQQKPLANIHTLAIGDSGNDISMLDAANTAIIIRSQTHSAPVLTRAGNLLTSSAYGPEGWAETVSLWLKNFLELGNKNYG